MARLLAPILTSFLAIVPASAQPDDSPAVFALSVSLKDGDRVVGAPMISLTAGQPATLTVERNGGYALTMTVSPVGDGSVVDIVSEIRFMKRGQWIDVAAPCIRTKLGSTASYESLPLPRNDGRPVAMTLLVNRAPPMERTPDADR